MKKYLNLLILFCVIHKAQNNFIVYDKIIDASDGLEIIHEKNILVFNNKNSIFFSYKGELEDVNKFLNNTEKIRSSQVIKNIFNKKYFQVKDNSFTRETLFAIDDYQNFNWNILQNEETKILGYKCHKAIGKFRGREYIAWFTIELPIDIGPFKFRGLPGAILKVSDKNNIFTFEALKILLNLPLQIDINSKFNFYFPDETNDYITFQKYVEIQNKHIEEMRSRIDADRPKGVIVISRSGDRDFDIEKTFEWENLKNP